jgi:hypothetical protein
MPGTVTISERPAGSPPTAYIGTFAAPSTRPTRAATSGSAPTPSPTTATVLQQAARRGIINAWTDSGVQYVSRAEVAVYLHHRADVIPSLPEPWASASRAIRDRYAGAYTKLKERDAEW